MHEPSNVAAETGTPVAHEQHGSIAAMALKVFVALCLLTCASLLTYTTYWQEHVPMQVGRAVMLMVSLTKAFLVVAFFMHLWWESKWKYVVTFPAMIGSTLLCIALVPDIGLRTQQYDAARLVHAPEPMPYTVGPQLEVSQPVISSASHANELPRGTALPHSSETEAMVDKNTVLQTRPSAGLLPARVP